MINTKGNYVSQNVDMQNIGVYKTSSKTDRATGAIIENVKGKLILDTIQSSGTYKYPINPYYMNDSRLRRFFSTFTYWEPKHTKFHWVPTCPTSSDGQIIMAVLNNPVAEIPESGLASYLTQYQGSAMGTIYSSHTAHLINRPKLTPFFTSVIEPAQASSAGQLVVSYTRANTGSGYLVMEYDWDLSIPSFTNDENGLQVYTSGVELSTRDVGDVIFDEAMNEEGTGSNRLPVLLKDSLAFLKPAMQFIAQLGPMPSDTQVVDQRGNYLTQGDWFSGKIASKYEDTTTTEIVEYDPTINRPNLATLQKNVDIGEGSFLRVINTVADVAIPIAKIITALL